MKIPLFPKVSGYSYLLIFLTFFFISFQNIAAQDSTDVKNLDKKVKFSVLPVIYYTPETKLALGAGSSLAFKLPESNEISSLQIGAVYTFRKQLLSYLPFNLFFKNDKRLKGEFGYYDFIYEYYGIGDIPGNQSFYTAAFPRFQVLGLKSFKKDIFWGASWFYNDYRFYDIDKSEQSSFDETTFGLDGGRVSSVGPTFLIDKRDGVYWTKKGYYLELGFRFSGGATGSEYEFVRQSIDYRRFIPVGEKLILGFQFFENSIWGDVPFFEYPILGGSKLLRGYYQGYLRDNLFVMAQTEFRGPLIWKFSYAIFAGIGTVSPNFGDLTQQRYWPSYGAGIRFPLVKEAGINLRLDYAFGRDVSGLYLTFGESF